MSVLAKDNDFYSLHGIWGADAALALGRIGRGSGMVVGDVQPPRRGMAVGYKVGSSDPFFLPFIPNIRVGLGADAYQAEEASADAAAHPEVLPGGIALKFFGSTDIERRLSMSGESWTAGKMTLEVVSFFGSVPDPASASREILREKMCPAIYARVCFDNRESDEPMIGVFGMQGVRRPLSDTPALGLLGFAHRGEWGFAARPEEGVSEVMDWMSLAACFDPGRRVLRHLANEGCLKFNVPPRQKKEYLVALGAFRDGIVTQGLKTRAFQNTLFTDLDDILVHALKVASSRLAEAHRLDVELDSRSLSDDRKFLICHAAHSYNASTELLVDESGSPIFIVNEGEYQMMNTLDLTVDQVFHELYYSPWTVKNELDFFFSRSSYRDSIGLAFCHDQGVSDCFTPQGTSSYELPWLTGCFSFMSYEETLNWILCACLYTHNADDGSWLRAHMESFEDAVTSIISRDRNGDGVMDVDSDRCDGGAEITTYDSLDVSLGQARNNLYVAVKAWGALVSAAAVLQAKANDQKAMSLADKALSCAALIAKTVVSRVDPQQGYIPAVFEGGNTSKIIPAVEALVYPYFSGVPDAVRVDGPYGDLISALKKHLDVVLVPGVCLDPVSGGWKLSSTSRNTWPSKIFISQFVAEEILGMKDGRTTRDAAHVAWQCNGCADYAATDQLDSATGKDMGSRLYPRLVSSILWQHPPIQ